MTLQGFREVLFQYYGYVQGRWYSILPRSLSDVYGIVVAKLVSLAILPLPLLSFLALPIYGGHTTTLNIVFFSLTWAGIVLTNDPITIELYGILVVRSLCFILPALGFLAFDLLFPSTSNTIKAQRRRSIPSKLGRNELSRVVSVALGNVTLSVLLQIALEQLLTRFLLVKSIVKVNTVIPLPWNIVTDIAKGMIIRGVLHYLVHRFLLHTYDTKLKQWHREWQHGIPTPFSLVAAYDHPVNFLLAEWLPALAPAYLMRWHVITWSLFLAIISLEELFICSGYSRLPSTIILAGMARRMEAHFDSVDKGKHVGNFGHIGIMDYVFRTVCKGEVTVVDDFRDEAEKRRFQQRVNEAVKVALASREQESKAWPDEDRRSDGEQREEVESSQRDQDQELVKRKGRRRGGKR